MKKITFFSIIAFLFVQICFISCKGDADLLPPTRFETLSNVEAKNKVKVRDGFLVFESKESFFDAVNSIAAMSNDERTQWENKIGFRSQYSIVTKLIDEELIKDSLNRIKYANVDVSKIDKKDYHSDYYYEVLAKGVIKLIDEGTPDEYSNYAAFDRGAAIYLNEDGLFAIADTLYRVTENKLQSIKLSEGDTKENLLKELNNNNILLRGVEILPFGKAMYGEEWATSGSKRIGVAFWLQTVEAMVSFERIVHFIFKHDFGVQCQKKNLVGNWVFESANVVINGSWTMRVFYIPQYYTSSHSSTINCNNLVSTINPETGNMAGAGTLFIVRPNAFNADVYYETNNLYRPVFTRLRWTATRTDVNLTVTLSYNW